MIQNDPKVPILLFAAFQLISLCVVFSFISFLNHSICQMTGRYLQTLKYRIKLWNLNVFEFCLMIIATVQPTWQIRSSRTGLKRKSERNIDFFKNSLRYISHIKQRYKFDKVLHNKWLASAILMNILVCFLFNVIPRRKFDRIFIKREFFSFYI